MITHFRIEQNFFYPKCGCFTPTVDGIGPPLPESSVDYQEIEFYVEKRLHPKFSGFVEIPVRFINPEVNQNSAGLGDVRSGFKYSLIESVDRLLTLQVRGYFPSGDGEKGLGTEHVSIEPGILFQRAHHRFDSFGEFKAWVPIGGSEETFTDGTVRDFSGTILRYGLGVSYDLYRGPCQLRNCSKCGDLPGNRLSLVNEMVGWTILDGLKFRTNTPDIAPGAPGFDQTFLSAAGDTIVNLKLGLRWTTPRDTVYVGYGTAITSDRWYEEVARVDYTIRF